MKTTPHLLLTAALAFGTSFARAQDEAKQPQPPPAPEAGARPPEPARPNPAPPPEGGGRPPEQGQQRPPDRERMRDDREKRDREPQGGPRGGERPGERDRNDAPRADREREKDHDRGPEKGGDKARGHDRERREDGDKPGDRRQGSGPNRGPGPDMAKHQPAAPPKPTSYLGVVTVVPPPVVSAQFGLAPGFGLVVADVLPDSPAAVAGVQKFDVLTKFNDQQLVDGAQFSTLVRAQAKDADATLTLFRKAQEQKVAVKVGEKMMPERRPAGPMGDLQHGGHGMNMPAPENLKKMQERLRDHAGKMHEFRERLRDWSQKPTADRSQPPMPPQLESGDLLRLDSGDVLREAGPGGAPLVTLLQPDAAVTYHTSDAKLLMKDDTGELEVSSKDGHRQAIAKNSLGETVFSGAIETADQRAALPEDLRRKIELIDVQSRMVRFDAPAFTPAELEENVQ